MKALYRTAAAVLAIGAGVVLAGLITAVVDGRDINAAWAVVFAVGALVAAGAAVVLWARALERR